MADSRDSHVVEIPMDQPQQLLSASASAVKQIQHHPLTEIYESPGHLLLLKLWQREENLVSLRIGAQETLLDNTKREAFQLCSLFFAFHGLFLTLLFTAAVGQSDDYRRACKNWWVPSFLSLLTSLVLICSVQVKICAYGRVSRLLSRERSDGRALARCVQELRMKGASFDLSKEPQTTKRMKSSSVEAGAVVLSEFGDNLLALLHRDGLSGLQVHSMWLRDQ